MSALRFVPEMSDEEFYRLSLYQLSISRENFTYTLEDLLAVE